MSKHKWTKEEIAAWRKEHLGTIGYFNKEDSNIIIPKAYGIGFTFNWAHPVSWIIIVPILALIIWTMTIK